MSCISCPYLVQEFLNVTFDISMMAVYENIAKVPNWGNKQQNSENAIILDSAVIDVTFYSKCLTAFSYFWLFDTIKVHNTPVCFKSTWNTQ